MPNIPALCNDFRVYLDSYKYLGLTSEIELPEITYKTDTLEGSGILGECEIPATGQIESCEFKLTFSNVSEELFKTLDMTALPTLTIRAAHQYLERDDKSTDYIGTVIRVQGKPKNVNLGSLKKGEKGEPELTLEVYSFSWLVNGEEGLYFDKIAYKYRVDGEDKMAPVTNIIE